MNRHHWGDVEDYPYPEWGTLITPAPPVEAPPVPEDEELARGNRGQ